MNFVSISIDRSHIDQWKKKVKDKKLEHSCQLIAFQYEYFKNDYGINGIPRFILIDEMRNIIDTYAESPSDPNLENQLSSLSQI